MNIETALEANPELSKSGEPSVRALDDPTMSPQPFAAFDTAAGDTGLDAALSQITPATREVIPFVSVQFARTLARLAVQARYRRNGIKRGFECHRIVPVGSRNRDSQRDAACIYDDVSFRSELASVRRVGAGFLPPRGLETLAPSRLARSQSIWSCSRNRRSIARCSRCHTPAACQSRRRRQHVMPLPKPSSCGRSSHGIPVCSTYRMSLSAARSSTVRRRPPLGDGENSGISGSSATHNSLLILRLAMQRTIRRMLHHVQVVLAALRAANIT
ncbi:Hypothetical protein bglu_1g19000 [Burkholderia glumae BGR1]|nr:Hypothetical protein bglu_1g19000 [Burkholderia glumae BGR1]AJY67187.1 hypothetical protein KS03_2746 [Burkholderia glumae LMG 2196 = ATCC 33617]QKM54456.1 hypothetical protein CG017_02491 [Burkholderia glumae]